MNDIQWLETEYLANDVTVQPVLINGGSLLYTLFDNKGYNYIFNSICDLWGYVYGGQRTYFETFATEQDMVDYLKNM